MSRDLLRRAFLVIPLGLATLAACTNTDTTTTAPKFEPSMSLAQGAGGVWTVNTRADPGDGVCDDTDCTLREAISTAAAGDQVVFAGGLQGTIALTIGPMTITKPLSIDAGGRITLNGMGTTGVMAVRNLNAPAIAVSLDGFTLTNGSSIDGGAGMLISSFTTVTVRNSTISGNHTTFVGTGGGIMNFGALTLINSTVSGNDATEDGGGIWNAGTLVIHGSTITDNVADRTGGGIYHSGSNATVIRSTISGNRANSIGGTAGIRSTGYFQLLSSTVTGNNGFVGGISSGGVTDAFTVANSIVAGNGSSENCVGVVNSLGYNVTTTGFNGCSFTTVSDVKVHPTLVFTAVLEQTLKDHGGPTMTHALIARGAAIDAGYCPGETTDQRGFTRPVDVALLPNAKDGCDIGAYEAQGPQVAVADLMISQTVNKSSVKQGDLLTYTVRVQNLGPQTAPNVVVNNLLSSGVTFVEARQNKGSITAPPRGETGTVTWNLGDMANQANEVAEIVVTVLVRGRTTITNTATVAGNVADPNAANNSAAITVTVVPGSSGKKG